MILYEHEGKELLRMAGVAIPRSQLLTSNEEKIDLSYPVVLKAQVLSGKRANAGGILKVEDASTLKAALNKMFELSILGEPVRQVLVEEFIESERAQYLSLTYDTTIRKSILIWSEAGGTGIEDRVVKKEVLNISSPGVPSGLPFPSDLIRSLINLFLNEDCLLLEINPLVYGQGSDGIKRWYALDAKVNLDDNAVTRHKQWSFSPRAVAGHSPTAREIAAKQIDQGDHRGTAGSAYLDLDGDIAILASGGGASLTAMDALIKAGGRPANYTEYSGNPPREKVEKLTEIVLSKPNLHGLWIVGAVANFTDIYETLMGIIEGLRKAEIKLGQKFHFPILIRRGGPRDEEAFAALREVKDFNLQVFGPEVSISKSAELMTMLARDYKDKSTAR